jgi:hypothetical protein
MTLRKSGMTTIHPPNYRKRKLNKYPFSYFFFTCTLRRLLRLSVRLEICNDDNVVRLRKIWGSFDNRNGRWKRVSRLFQIPWNMLNPKDDKLAEYPYSYILFACFICLCRRSPHAFWMKSPRTILDGDRMLTLWGSKGNKNERWVRYDKLFRPGSR